MRQLLLVSTFCKPRCLYLLLGSKRGRALALLVLARANAARHGAECLGSPCSLC